MPGTPPENWKRELSGGGASPTSTGAPGARSAQTGAWSDPVASALMSQALKRPGKAGEGTPPAARIRSIRVP